MLAPYRVLDLTDERGALAGMILAALGAEVIAIEPDEGSHIRRIAPFVDDSPGVERSLWHMAYNRGKSSVTTASTDLPALAADADVVIDCGAIPVDLAALRRANPALVTVSISAFGHGGPKDGWAATDLVALAASGSLVLSGDDDRPPVRISVPQGWLHASSDAACGALMALMERVESGLGQHVDVSAQISAAQATQSYILSSSFGATTIQRFGGGIRIGELRVPLVFPARDGHVAITFLFGSAIGPFTARLLACVYEAGYCDETVRDLDCVSFAAELLGGKIPMSEWDRIKASVAAYTSSRTRGDLFATAVERRLLLAPVATASDVLASDQFASRHYWDRLEVDGRGVRVPGRFAKLSASPLPALRPAPRLGQHDGTVRPRTERQPIEAADATRELPLAGLKVVDLMWVMAGPAVTRVMADFGATVIRVDSKHRLDTARTIGPYWRDEIATESSAIYQNMNAGKLNIAIDLSHPDGRDVVVDLIRWADVMTESFTPGVMEKWGLDYEAVRSVNPGIVMMSSCLMGQTGPLSRFAGYGNLAAAFCGFTAIAGWPDRPPAGPFGAYTDYMSPRFALATVLAAIDHRRRTGEGQYIDFSQAEAALHFLAPGLLDFELNGRSGTGAGNSDLNIAPHGVYPAAGADRWVAIASETDEQWGALASAIGREDLAWMSAQERLMRARELDELIAQWTRGLDDLDAQDRLQALGVPAHAVQNSPGCRADPQLQALGHFVATEHAEFGAVELEGSRLFLSETPARVGAAPTIGEHLFAILENILGYDQEKVTQLLTSGALE
jgi:crotonobetainyl-CoA:carnitine CoA-transferase CaiB-like acyl-CoA transferase